MTFTWRMEIEGEEAGKWTIDVGETERLRLAVGELMGMGLSPDDCLEVANEMVGEGLAGLSKLIAAAKADRDALAAAVSN